VEIARRLLRMAAMLNVPSLDVAENVIR